MMMLPVSHSAGAMRTLSGFSSGTTYTIWSMPAAVRISSTRLPATAQVLPSQTTKGFFLPIAATISGTSVMMPRPMFRYFSAQTWRLPQEQA